MCEEFLRDSEVRGLSDWTIKVISTNRLFFSILRGKLDTLMSKDLGLDILAEYVLYMKEIKGIYNPVTLIRIE